MRPLRVLTAGGLVVVALVLQVALFPHTSFALVVLFFWTCE